MKKKILLSFMLICISVFAFGMLTVSAYTGTKYGDYLYYTESNGEIKITDCDESATVIDIPETIDGKKVTSIGDYAFYSCKGLTNVMIPDGVASIGSTAFGGCSGLTSITIGNGVTSIGDDAFFWCTGLTSITIPNSVTIVGSGVFSWCTGLTSVTIPDSVTSIGGDAFHDCSGLTSVTIPNSVTSIGYGAFEGCTGLTSVNITDIAAWCNIDFNSSYSTPLYYAKKLYLNGKLVTDLVIPGGITKIKAFAFYNCSNLTSVTIPDSVTSIGYDAFYNCSKLINVTIPDSVTSIYGNAFYNTGIYNNASNVLYIGNYLICAKTSLSGGYTVKSGITHIAIDAFHNCKSLTSITIPASVKGIGGYAFDNCSGLTSVNITDIAAWCNIDFNGYYSNPLYYAKNLYLNGNLVTELIIPDGVTGVKNYAFYNCMGLTSVTIPDSVTSIGNSAFCDCSGLTSVNITDIAAWCNIDFGYDYGPSNPLRYAEKLYLNGKLVTDLVIPDGVTEIKSYAFFNCECLTSVTIPNSVTSIGDDAFSSCSGLTNVMISDGVTSIGDDAFSWCTGLTSVTIPDSVTCVGNKAFNYCTGLTQINWNAKKVADLTSSSEIFYNAGTGGKGINIVFGDNTEYIPAYLFYVCSSSDLPKITSVTIGNGVTSIGDDAFSWCTGLTSVNITDIAAWCNIDFSGYYSNPLYYAKNLYLNGNLVTDLIIPDGVTAIKSYAFYNCKALTSVTIPNSVTSIGGGAFDDCSGLTCVNITDIAAWCNIDFSGYYSNPLYYAKNLYLNGNLVTDLIIPDGVTEIKKYAFYYCSALTSVTIPDSVTSIGYDAFYYYYRLKNVYYHGTEEEWNNISIGDENEYLNNAKRTYFAYVTFLGEYNSTDNVKQHPLNSCINIADFEEKTGYTLHFYTDEECAKEFDVSTTITEDTTLYLKYVVNQYTYKFLDEDNKTILKEARVDYGTTITPPEAPADKDPYTFDYWDGYTAGMTLSDDVEFKAVYKYKDYKITVDGLENPVVVTYNSSFNIEPQKIDDYHYFIGYFTESDGKGRQITNEKGESLKAYDVVGDLTVYPYFYSGYMNKVELQGVATAMPGDTIRQNAIFATDKEAMYVTATIKYPEYLNFQSISGGDFAEASKDSETLNPKQVADLLGHTTSQITEMYYVKKDTSRLNGVTDGFEI